MPGDNHAAHSSEDGNDALRLQVERLISPAERDELIGAGDAIGEVVAMYRRLSGRLDVRDLYRRGRPFHEVPFTMTAGGATVRGTIDCLVRVDDTVTILEFKTGRPRPEDQSQVLLYRRAVETIFPDVRVDARLVYLQHTETVGC
jgi:ATP-dependent exoDNAse (exonuclease V) beta subunit